MLGMIVYPARHRATTCEAERRVALQRRCPHTGPEPWGVIWTEYGIAFDFICKDCGLRWEP